jgi:hypothetical protein
MVVWLSDCMQETLLIMILPWRYGAAWTSCYKVAQTLIVGLSRISQMFSKSRSSGGKKFKLLSSAQSH